MGARFLLAVLLSCFDRGVCAWQQNVKVVILRARVGEQSDWFDKLPVAGVNRVFCPPDRRKIIRGTEGDMKLLAFHLRQQRLDSRRSAVYFETRTFPLVIERLFRCVRWRIRGDDLDGITSI